MEKEYDNENFYNDISPKDYLTYQLVYIKKNVKTAFEDAAYNQKLYELYKKEVETAIQWGVYSTSELPQKQELLNKIEKELVKRLIKTPALSVSITVTLWQTNIRGTRIYPGKRNTFNSFDIQYILERLEEKSGDFYKDEYIWRSICRVERGKVSNKIRFAIYQRDGYRCRKCGASTKDLEIDHIFPISKGGKSNIENLQTLCHDCNVRKSNIVEQGSINPNLQWRGLDENCPLCGAPLSIKRGKYGKFYSCSNFPNCKYTKAIR